MTNRQRETQLSTSGLRVCDDVILPVKSVGDLGSFIDSDLTMASHVTKMVSRYFAALRHLRAVRRSVSSDVFRSLIASMVLTRLGYGNAALAGISTGLVNGLQSVLNAAARTVVGLRQRDH